MTTGKALNGKPYAGNPHVAPSQRYGGTSRFDEGEVAPAATPRRGSLLYNVKFYVVAITAVIALSAAAETLPLIVWGTLAEEDATQARYAEMKEAGFTHVVQSCASPEAAKRILGEAEKAGVKLILGLRGLRKMTESAKQFTAACKNSPALEYYSIVDEPHKRHFPLICKCVSQFKKFDPAHPCFVNVFGALCNRRNRKDKERQMDKTGFETHDEYIRALYAAVPLKVISFDMYPILSFKPLEDGDFRLHGQRVFLKERWYETLETTSAFAAERGIPMFAFALLSAHRHYPGQDYPVPTMEHFRLQQYSNLAYGAQGLEYFRWYIKEPYHGYNSAPILYDGKRGPMFERVREFNAELQARAYVFVGAKVVKVRHAGIDIPLGTKRFEEKDLPSFVTAFSTLKNGEAVVSYLKNGGRDYFMVVNRSPNDDMAFTAKFAPGAEIVRRDGSRASLDAYSDVFWLDPGDAAIFTQATQTNKGTGR